MGNTLMQHRLAIAGFKLPGMKLSWRKRMKKFKNTIRDERAGRELQVEARNGMMMLTKLVVLLLSCALPRLWMSTLYSQEGESLSSPSLHSTPLVPSSTSCLRDLVLDKVRICQNISIWQNVHPIYHVQHCSTELVNSRTEMEKRADGADASVLFFLHSCANFLAVCVQIR